MVSWRLVFRVAFIACVSCVFARDVGEVQRAWVAPEAAEAAPSVQGFHPESSIWTSGKENSQKTETEKFLAGKSSFFSGTRSSFPHKTVSADDVALQAMQGEQWREARVLQELQCSLVADMAKTKAPITQQECKSNLLQEYGAKQSFRRRRKRLECFSRKCPMDTFNAFRKSCEQEDGSVRWSWCQGITGGTTSDSTSFIASSYRNFVSGRREDSRAPQRIAKCWNRSDGTDGAAAAEVDGQAASSSCSKSPHTWASQSPEQAQDTGCLSRRQGDETGSRVEGVCGSHDAESASTCRAVSEMQVGSSGGIQHEIGRASRLETRDQLGFDDNVGAVDNQSDDPRGAQCWGAGEGSRRGDSGRRISGRGGSYRRHGRCRRDGFHGFWTTEQNSDEVAKAVSRSHFSHESGTAASQAEDPRCQGCRDEGEGAKCLTQKDSGVERDVSSDSNDIELILAGWWQEFDGLCHMLHTWQQPGEQDLRHELKESGNVPVCQPSVLFQDGHPGQEDHLSISEFGFVDERNCYVEVSGSLQSQHKGEAHTWIRHALASSDASYESDFVRMKQNGESLLRGSGKGNLDLSGPQAKVCIDSSDSHALNPTIISDAGDKSAEFLVNRQCLPQHRSKRNDVDVGFSCHFPRAQGWEFEPQHFAVGASDNTVYGHDDQQRRQGDFDVPYGIADVNQSLSFCNEKLADWVVQHDSVVEESRRYSEGACPTVHELGDEDTHDSEPHLRGCKEGNLDLLEPHGEEQVWSAEHNADSALFLEAVSAPKAKCRPNVSKCDKHVSFDEKVHIVCYQQDDVCQATIVMADQDQCCRSLWHMHGQITNIRGFQHVMAHFGLDASGKRLLHDAESSITVADHGSGRESQNVGNSHDANSERALREVVGELTESSLPIFADIWFLATNRFPVCVRARALRMEIPFFKDPMRLEIECRRIWQELDNGGPVNIQVLGGVPTRRSAVRLHIILTQDPSSMMDTTIFYSDSLPPLFKFRAVLFPRSIDVNSFFAMAQVEGACHAGVKSCYTRCWESGEEILKSNQDLLWVPSNKYIEGDIRIAEDEGHMESEESDHDSEASTRAASQADSVESDECFLMSGGPPLFQLDDYMQHMWETAGLDDVNMQDEGQEPIEVVQSDILYAPQHLGHLHDEIDRLRDLQNEDGSEWTAATFGLGLVDLGRRDVRFNPFNLRGLLEAILNTWSDHSHYGNLVVYNVHPQPVDFLGPRMVAVLVVIELPESLDPTIRNVLVVEQAVAEVGARPQPYGARLTCEASEREILAQLQLHHHCPPFALRPCHVRLGEVILEKEQFYEFDHGSLCRTWIGNVHSQVLQAEQEVCDAEKFFLQAHAFMEADSRPSIITCRVHGITPQNRPMGSRDIHIDPVWLYDLEWIGRMKMLWPFEPEFVGLYFVQSATGDRFESGSTVFHFIARCGHHEGLPILVNQQLVAVEAVPQEPQDVQEFWAISIPSGEIGFHVVANMPSRPFWFDFARRQRIYPHLAVNGVRMRDVRQHWMPGDVLQARFLVWQKHHVLTMLVGMAQERSDDEPEVTSFLQLGGTKTKSKSKDKDQLDEAFTEICCSIRDQGIRALQENAEVSISHSVQSDWPTYVVESQDLHESGEGNVECRNNADGWAINTLHECLNRICERGHEGINSDFTLIPHMHPHAQIAAQWVAQAPANTNVWHIFTDGSAKHDKATWAMVILKELCVQDRIHYVRVGYAAGEVTDDIGRVDQNAMDAEATAIIAMIEFALANCDRSNMAIYCHFDALTVGFGALGASAIPCKRDSTSERQKAARLLMTVLEGKAEQLQSTCKGVHVCAHQGHPWNEMVDSIAKEVWKGWKPMKKFHFKSGPLLQHRLADWAWIEAAPSHELPGLESILANESPMEDQGVLDETLQCATNQNLKSIQRAEIKIATANVGTMLYGSDHEQGVSCKAMELLRQFEEKGVHIIGVQESRASRTQCIDTGPYTRLIVAGERGNAGVELWVNGRAIAQTFHADFNPSKDFCVWFQDKRIIAVRCNFGQAIFDILVLYAPQSGRPSQEIHMWWDELERVVATRDRNVNLICMGDFNCKIGSIVTEGVGDHAGEMEDEGGERFREFCEKQNLVVPSTFAHWHQGVTHTFVSAHNTCSRLDYIAISAACQEGIVESHVDEDMDMMNGDRDHRPLVTTMALRCVQGQIGRMKKCNLYDRLAARVSKKQQQLSLFDSFPMQEWSADVNLHWSHLRQHMQEQAVQSFPCPKRKQRQLYFSEVTWNMLCDRKELRKQHRELQRQIQRHLLKRVFQAWTLKGNLQDQKSLWDLDLSMLRQQEAVVLEARRKLDVRFRTCKGKDWKAWVDKILSDNISKANMEGNDRLYHTLKPKKMIAKHCGKLVKPLPGLRNAEGEWQFSREAIAEGWQRQFGQIEHAENVPFEALMCRSRPKSETRTLQQLEEIPTLLDVEKALRDLNDAKAPGLDGLGAELFQANCAQAAKRIYPLVLKMGLRCQGIPELSGGWLLPLFKGKGSAQQMLGYRAILLEPVVARAMSRAWRPKLIRGLEALAMPMQWGGRAGLSIEALHLQVQLWQANATKRKESQGLIFIDIRAAFYNVVKQLLTAEGSNDPRTRAVFEKMKLPESVWENFAAHVDECSLICQSTGSDILAQSTQAMLTHTWFAVPEASCIAAPMTGSRPGDPNADVLFGMIQARVLATLHQRAAHVGMPLFPESGSDLRVPNCVTWVDDIAVSITSTPSDVVARTMQMLSLVRDVMLEFGLQLSFGVGKTAAMITFHGKGASKARQSFESKQSDHLTILTEHQGAVQVPVVTHYKHLGGFITKSGSKLQEIRIRGAATMAKLKPLRKLMKSPDLEVEKKRLILQSMGISVLTLHSGTWFNLTQSEFTAWQAAVFRTYQMIQPRQADGNVPHMHFYKLASEAGMPMPMELLYVQRLKLLFHIMGVQDRFMIQGILENHEVNGSSSWLYGAVKSVKWMRSQVGNFKVPEELDELHDVGTWELFAPHAKQLQQSLKKVQQAHLYKIRALCAVKDHSIRQNEILMDMGWTFDGPRDQNDEKDVHQCDDCDGVFETPAALAVHQQKRHGKRIAMRRFAIDSCCRACGRFYHTRPRLLRHLHVGNTDCWVWHCRRYIPMTNEETEAKDDEDRKKGVAMHQKGFADVEFDKMWRPCTEAEIVDRLQCKDDAMECSDPVTDCEVQQWSRLGMLPPGRGGRTKTARRPTDFHMFNVNRDIAMLEKTMLKEVGQWSPDFAWVPRPLSCGARYFLVLFSGHRRFADIAQQMSWKSNIIPICVDLAVDPWHGNILRDTLWLQLIRARKVAGAHAGPPCETYSFARWIEVEGGGPRPLRTTSEPWGKDELTIKEVEQVFVGTVLMLQAIYLLLLVFLHGGSFSLEHPKGQGGKDGKWSIWDSAFVQQLLLCAEVRRVDFLQGPLGQPFPKPTSMLTGRLDQFATLLFDHYQPNWKPSDRLGGREKDSRQWKTAKAKAYPPLLCKAVVEAHLLFAETITSDHDEPEPEGLHAALQALAQPFDPYSADNKGAVMGADYWGRALNGI